MREVVVVKKGLPQWFIDNTVTVDEKSKVVIRGLDEGLFEVKTFKDGKTASKKFKSIEDAHSYAKEVCEKHLIFTLKIKPSVKDVDEKLRKTAIGYLKKVGDSCYLYIDDRLHNPIRDAEEDYKQFLVEKKRFEEEQNFENSYKFLDCHPVFWVKNLRPKEIESYRELNPLGDVDTPTQKARYWVTDGFVNSKVSIIPVFKGKRHYFIVETGEHTPNLIEHYFDPELMVRAKTFEKAVIKIAKKINEVFDEHGERREDGNKEKE